MNVTDTSTPVSHHSSVINRRLITTLIISCRLRQSSLHARYTRITLDRWLSKGAFT